MAPLDTLPLQQLQPSNLSPALDIGNLISNQLSPFLVFAGLLLQLAEINQAWMTQSNNEILKQNALAEGAGQQCQTMQSLLATMTSPDDQRDLPSSVETFCESNNIMISTDDGPESIDKYLTSIGKPNGKGLNQEQLGKINSALGATRDQASNFSSQITLRMQSYMTTYNNAMQGASNAIKQNSDAVSGILRNM